MLDPLPRYLSAEVLTDDTLRVGDVTVAGENRRIRELRRLLRDGRPVAGTGVRWVVVQHGSGSVDPAWLAGLEMVHDGPFLTLYRDPAAPPAWRAGPPGPARWAVVVALAGALLVVGFAAL